jgi:hypothetical protein
MGGQVDETTGETGGEPCWTSGQHWPGLPKGRHSWSANLEAKQSRAQYDMLLYLDSPYVRRSAAIDS